METMGNNLVKSEIEDWELDLLAQIVGFLLFRQLFVAVLLGLLPAVLGEQVPDLYRWLACGSAGGALLCWYLPARGPSILLSEEEPVSERRKRLLRSRFFIGVVLLLALVLAMGVSQFHHTVAWYVGSSIMFSACLGASLGLSLRVWRPLYYKNSKIEVVDYRIHLSYSLWTIFSGAMLLMMLL